MKETLRQRIESINKRLSERMEMLEKSIEAYKRDNMFEDAMKNDIKLRQLKMIKTDIEKALE